jgi:N-acetylglucosaminyldiphosphoundecaprenol N-acetyl-beta-D-mannosaminyltransferase
MGDGHLSNSAGQQERAGSGGPALRSIRVIGCRVDRLDSSEALQRLAGFCAEERPHLVVTADASMLVRAQTDQVLYNILETADLVVPDSIGVVWGSRVLGTPLTERVAGVDLMDLLCEHCMKTGLRVFLLGAAPGVAERAAGNLKACYPGLVIAGTHHGYFTEEDEPGVLQQVMDAHPDVIFVAMGIPRQEKWLRTNLARLPARVGMGVGGSLDVAAGNVKRAPSIFQETNMEWLYRVTTDPRRFRKALLLPKFVWLAIQYRFLRRKHPLA